MNFKNNGLTILMVLALISAAIGCQNEPILLRAEMAPQYPGGDSLGPILLRAEVAPQYPGGDSLMTVFIQKNLKYPEQIKKSGVKGKVFAGFVVEKDGSLTHFEILRGLQHGCDEAVIQTLKTMPKWIPGKNKGKPVRVRFVLPVEFK